MENRKIRLFFLTLMLLFPLGLTSQEEFSESIKTATGENFFIREDAKGAVFIQKLSWDAIDDIEAYEFILEENKFNKKTKTSKWTKIQRKILKETSYHVSLPPGKYRFKVSIINLLGQVETSSEYRKFDIKIAYQPSVYSVSPDAIYFDEEYPDIISLRGKNFHEDTLFYLKSTSGSRTIRGKVLEVEKKHAKIQFNMHEIPPGEYAFTVVDPSGLKDGSKTVIFKFQKPVDIYLSGGYVFTGFAGNKTFKKYFGTSVAPLGAGLRLSVMFAKRTYGAFGLNFTGTGFYLKKKQDDYVLSAGFLIPQINAAYIVPIIKRRLNFDLHLGVAPMFLVRAGFSFDNQFKSDTVWAWGVGISGGTAFQVYVYKKLYVEVNLDHIIGLRKGFPAYIAQPSLSIGWEF